MLRQHFAAVAAVALPFAFVSSQLGDEPDVEVVCDVVTGICVVVADKPGKPWDSDTTRPTRTGGQQACVLDGEVVPCHDPQFGWFNPSDGCYYRELDPQPPRTDPVWEGNYPEGAVYAATCPGAGGTGGGWVWRATPPPRVGGGVTAAELAARAISQLRLDGPAIGTVPEPGNTGLVGMPVWLWTDVMPQTWGPTSATASVPGLSVTAIARATHIDWDMGDGHTVRCDNPGTPYHDEFGDRASPTCGHTYKRTSASQPGEAYTVAATTTWLVTWTGGGESGEVTLTRPSSTQVRIGELQVLVQ